MLKDDKAPAEADPTGVVLAQAAEPGEVSAVWLVHSGRAVPLRTWAATWPCARFSSVTELVQQWDSHRAGLQRLIEQPQTADTIAENGVPVMRLRVESPLRPAQLFCTIGNYRRQVVEAAVDAADSADAEIVRATTEAALRQRQRDGAPYVCLTSIDRIAGPFGELLLDPTIDTLDWEVEVGVVIGGSGSGLNLAEAGAAVAGYSVVNDLTIRSRVLRRDLPGLGSDWLQCKGLHGSLPLGPWFVPAWQVSGLAALRLRLSLNGIPMQDGTVDDMVFSIPQQLSYLSRHTRLRPGDLLCTGSPAGFGVHHGRLLRSGDVVHASVTGLGEQATRIVDQTGRRESYPLRHPAWHSTADEKEHAS
jgi:2,4-didehydro-3-deoxy-L-rhamnonate hydrolase